MRYDTKESKAGVSIQVTPLKGNYISLNNGNKRRLVTGYFKTKPGNWIKSKEDYWIYLGPTTLTDWNE